VSDTLQKISEVAKSLKSQGGSLKDVKFLIGFDGMVDQIIHVVDKRITKDNYKRIDTIEEFGKKILAASGKSSNIELVTKVTKAGGNAPLMSMAVSGMGAKVCCMGILGYPEILPVFSPVQENCEVISIAPPGETDALEFNDGKLMLGKLASVSQMCWKNISERLGEDKFKELLLGSDFVACTNWTMLTEFEEIIDNVIRLIPDDSGITFFFDIADPEKREQSELLNLFEQMKKLDKKGQCLLGLNLREAEQILELLKSPSKENDDLEGVQKMASQIKNILGLSGVVIHSVSYAGADWKGQLASVKGPYTPKPTITTGAGDHFNGGFCSGIMAGLSLEEALYVGTATSGWYVRNGGPSPKINDVVGLLEQWSKNELE